MQFDALQTLHRLGGVVQGKNCFFVSTNTDSKGRHTTLLDSYVNCDVIVPHHLELWHFAYRCVSPFQNRVNAIVCAATGDIVLATYARIVLAQGGSTPTLAWADRHARDGSLHIERQGFKEAVNLKHVLIINDRIASGGTTRQLVELVNKLRGTVVGVSAISAPSDLTPDALGVPEFQSLCRIDTEIIGARTATPEQRQVPIVTDASLGHGAEFQQENPNWPGGFITLKDLDDRPATAP